MGLSSVTRTGGLVVVSAVTAGRAGECAAVQVMTCAANLTGAGRALRRAGYKRVNVDERGRLPVTGADLDLAVANHGAVFERVWLDPAAPRGEDEGQARWREVWRS